MMQRVAPRLSRAVQIRRHSSQQSRAVGSAGGAGASADLSRSATAAPWSGHRKLCTAAVGMLAGLSGLAASFWPAPGSADDAKGTRSLPVFRLPRTREPR